jgi:hypothetical protein
MRYWIFGLIVVNIMIIDLAEKIEILRNMDNRSSV